MEPPDPSPQPLLLPVASGRAQIAGDKMAFFARRGGLAILSVAATLVTGYALWGTPTDDLSVDDKTALAAAAANVILAPTRVNLDDPGEMEKARASLDLPPAVADKLIEDIRQADRAETMFEHPQTADSAVPQAAAPTTKPSMQETGVARRTDVPHPSQPRDAAAKPANIQFAWISLYDFLDEDGDVVQVSTGGMTRTLFLKKIPTVISVPIVPGDFLRLTGVHDGGGGGVTVGVQAGATEVKMVLDVGQTLTLPVR